MAITGRMPKGIRTVIVCFLFIRAYCFTGVKRMFYLFVVSAALLLVYLKLSLNGVENRNAEKIRGQLKHKQK